MAAILAEMQGLRRLMEEMKAELEGLRRRNSELEKELAAEKRENVLLGKKTGYKETKEKKKRGRGFLGADTG